MSDSKKAILASAVVVSALAVIATGALVFKKKHDRKKMGGRLIRVNYKFSKEFDD